MHDQRRGDAAFMVVVLVAPERGVLQRRPRLPAEDRRAGGARRIAFQAALGAALGVTSVVGQEQDKRVIERAALLERRDQPPHCRVDVRHARSIDGHDVIEAVLLRLGQLVPG